MDAGQDGDGRPAEWRSVMVDLSGSSLAELVEGDDDTALARALRRVTDDLARPGEPIAGFNSAL
ncbi:FxSxx-COOH cyclophane-containing RiPP peptide [Actinoplanes sp. GCM10030250]|uniref:FxSxx-COOH cyclophane-containing RiPP peptide n=1 Tax=Actinoplanes sp. GCM10030250 TaxID=3273376 RepID=UPI003622ABFB